MPLLKAKPAAAVIDAPKQDAPTPEQTVKVAVVKAFVKKAAASETMSKADWASKDARISRQGLFQAALQSVGLLQYSKGTTLEEYLDTVEQVVERGLAFVNRA